jgi:hypothetical protein
MLGRRSGETMFVRFREYNLAKGHKSLRCEIVENFRDKCSGKVRQRSISYLASVKEQWTKYPRVRVEFWRRIEEKLSRLPLSEFEAQKIRSAINRRIPREASLILQQITTWKEANVINDAPVPSHIPSSNPSRTVPEQSAEELLADLQRRLRMNS